MCLEMDVSISAGIDSENRFHVNVSYANGGYLWCAVSSFYGKFLVLDC